MVRREEKGGCFLGYRAPQWVESFTSSKLASSPKQAHPNPWTFAQPPSQRPLDNANGKNYRPHSTDGETMEKHLS